MRTTLLVAAADRYISENGIVAVLGDEDQFVKGGLQRINRPLSIRRGIWIKCGGMVVSAQTSGQTANYNYIPCKRGDYHVDSQKYCNSPGELGW